MSNGNPFEKRPKWLSICDGVHRFLLDKMRDNLYTKRPPTAIGGTMNRCGPNVYWHVHAPTVEQLPLPERFDIKGLVTKERAVYDATPEGWVRNDSDTAFIGGKVSYSIPQLLAGMSPRVMTICKDLNNNSKTTQKTYKRLIRSLVKQGAVISRPEYLQEKLSSGSGFVVVELSKSHNDDTCITSVNFAKPTTVKHSPMMLQVSSFAALVVSKKSITIYRHRLLACGANVVI